MLTTDDFYDILSANERLLEENRHVQRLATETPRSAQLQERYLQQAARLGLIPARFTSPVRPSLSLLVPKPTSAAGNPAPSAAAVAAQKRPVPPPGYGGGRLSRDRAARELAHAGSTQCNSAAAALAATEALYQRSPRHRFRSTNRASGSSDSDSSKDSNSGSSSTTLTSSKLDLGNLLQSADDASRGRNGGRRSSDEWFRSSATMRTDGSSADGQGDRSNSGPRRERGSTRLAVHLSAQSDGTRGGRPRGCSCGDFVSGHGGNGGSRVGRFLREPTPSFLRRWKAARKRKHAKKQVVRFLLRTSDELGEVEGKGSGGAAGAGGSKTTTAGTGSAGGGSSGGATIGPGVVIAYPGSSVLFPPAALPYSLAEALEAVQRQTAHLQLCGEWGREGGKGIAVATAAAAPSQPLTPPHHHPTRAVDLNNPLPAPRLDAAAVTAAAAATAAPSSHSHPLRHPSPRQYQLPFQQMQLHRELIPAQRPAIYGELDLAASPTGFSGAQLPSPYMYSPASIGGAPPPRWAIAVAPTMGAMHPGGTAVSPQPLSTVAAAAGMAVPAGTSGTGAAAPGGFPGTARGMVGIHGHPPFTASRFPGLVRPTLRDDLGYGYDRYLHGSYDRSPLYGSVGVSAPGTPQGFLSPAGLVGLMGRGFQSAGGSVGVGVGGAAQVANSGSGSGSGPASAVTAQSNAGLQHSAHSMPVYTSVADTPMHTDPRVGISGGFDAVRSNPVLQSSSSPPGPRELTSSSSGRSGQEAPFPSSAKTGSVAAGPHTGGSGDSGGSASASAATAFEADSVRRAWLNDLPDDAPGSPVLSDPDIPSEAVSEASDIAAPAAAHTVRPGDPYLQSLREHQSAIFRDVQVLMQRLADVRDRLGT